MGFSVIDFIIIIFQIFTHHAIQLCTHPFNRFMAPKLRNTAANHCRIWAVSGKILRRIYTADSYLV